MAPLAAEPPAKEQPGIVAQAKSHLEAKREAKAEELLTEYLHANAKAPDAPEAYLLLGKAQARQKRIDDALRTFAGLV